MAATRGRPTFLQPWLIQKQVGQPIITLAGTPIRSRMDKQATHPHLPGRLRAPKLPIVMIPCRSSKPDSRRRRFRNRRPSLAKLHHRNFSRHPSRREFLHPPRMCPSISILLLPRRPSRVRLLQRSAPRLPLHLHTTILPQVEGSFVNRYGSVLLRPQCRRARRTAAKPQSNRAKRLECAQLAAAVERGKTAEYPGPPESHWRSEAAAS